MYRILVASKLHPILRERLEEHGYIVTVKTGLKDGELKKMAGLHDVLVVRSKPPVTRDVIEEAARGNLKLIVRAGVGLDNIDLEAAREYGVKVENIPEASTQSVVELAIGLMYSLARNIPQANREVKSGLWRKSNGIELSGKTLLVIGLGRIGGKLAETGKHLGLRVVTHDLPGLKQKARKLGVEFEEDLCKALGKADIISIHVPLTQQTRHMINKETVKCIKPGALLINTSRGEVVDSKTLLEALEKDVIQAAALDVMENEPPKTIYEKKLVDHPRVIITPHIGASTKEAQKRVAETTAAKIIHFLNQVKQPLSHLHMKQDNMAYRATEVLNP